MVEVSIEHLISFIDSLGNNYYIIENIVNICNVHNNYIKI